MDRRLITLIVLTAVGVAFTAMALRHFIEIGEGEPGAVGRVQATVEIVLGLVALVGAGVYWRRTRGDRRAV